MCERLFLYIHRIQHNKPPYVGISHDHEIYTIASQGKPSETGLVKRLRENCVAQQAQMNEMKRNNLNNIEISTLPKAKQKWKLTL